MAKKELTKDLINVIFRGCEGFDILEGMVNELGLEIKSVHHGDTLCVQY